MVRQCLLQANSTTVRVTGDSSDELIDVVAAAHNESNWLQTQERASVFAEHR